MKKYDSYRDSGLGWAGQIPSHWEVEKVKYAYRFFTGGTPPTKVNEYFEGNNKWANISDIKGKEIRETGKKLSDQGVEVARIMKSPKGSLFYSFKLSVGAVAFCGEDMYTNEAIATFMPGKNSLRYLYYLAPLAIIQNANVNIYGAYILNQELINNAFLVLPPLTEQEAIASYLDTQTARIDNVIQARESKIKLLEELRASIIYKAVTKGISNNAETKDSGIEWIGKIPKHWEAMKVAHVFETIGSGTTPKTTVDEYYSNEGINWLQTGELKDGHIKETSKKITQKALNELGLTIYPRGSVVVAMYGATIGKVGILDIDTTTNQACCVLNSKKYMIPDFAFFAFISAKESLISLSYGGGQPNISQEKIRSHKIPVPPIEEQKEITLYIKEKLLNIKNSIEQSQREIELLKEYRSSLISEVVTGKRKVVL